MGEQQEFFKADADIVGAVALRRTNGAQKRRVFRQSAVSSAAELIGAVNEGDEICGLTNGQFSLIDIIDHLLSCTGPADIAVATWTMGIYDADRAESFVNDRRIKSARWIVDPSMFSRRPELSGRLVQAFGVESFRAVNCHAKFATIRGESLAICIRSSMNLNPNKRVESFDISACDATTRFFEQAVDSIFEKVTAENRSQASGVFTGLLGAEPKRGNVRPNPWQGLD